MIIVVIFQSMQTYCKWKLNVLKYGKSTNVTNYYFLVESSPRRIWLLTHDFVKTVLLYLAYYKLMHHLHGMNLNWNTEKYFIFNQTFLWNFIAVQRNRPLCHTQICSWNGLKIIKLKGKDPITCRHFTTLCIVVLPVWYWIWMIRRLLRFIRTVDSFWSLDAVSDTLWKKHLSSLQQWYGEYTK